jgi:tellurite resistance-related uncharacterized protein
MSKACPTPAQRSSHQSGHLGPAAVLDGEVRLIFVDPPSEQLVTPDRPAIIPPQATHHVVPLGPMTMQVEFYRERPFLGEDAGRG